jgi:hypothetical protein
MHHASIGIHQILLFHILSPAVPSAVDHLVHSPSFDRDFFLARQSHSNIPSRPLAGLAVSTAWFAFKVHSLAGFAVSAARLCVLFEKKRRKKKTFSKSFFEFYN